MLLLASIVEAKTIKIERIYVKGGIVNLYQSDLDNIEPSLLDPDENNYSLKGTTLTVSGGVFNIGVKAIKELTVENGSICDAALLVGASKLTLKVNNAVCYIQELRGQEVTIQTDGAHVNIAAMTAQRQLPVSAKTQSVVKIHNLSAPEASFTIEDNTVADLSDIDTQRFKISIADGCVASITSLQASDVDIDSAGNVRLEGQCKEARLTSRANILNASGLRAVNVKLQRKGGYISEPASGQERTPGPRAGRILP